MYVCMYVTLVGFLCLLVSQPFSFFFFCYFLFFVHYSLFIAPCLLFLSHCFFFVVSCSLFLVRCVQAFGNEQFDGMASKIESAGDDADGEKKSKKLFNYGFLNFFKSGEYHHNNQPLIKTLHSAIRTHDLQLYNLYEQSVKTRPPTTLRDALEFGE